MNKHAKLPTHDSNSQSDKSQSDKSQCNKSKIIYISIGIILLCILILIIYLILHYIYNKFKGWEEKRDDIDNRDVNIYENVIDYKCMENKENITSCTNYCSNQESCIFKCKYIRENLVLDKKPCEYNDWMDIWKWVLIIWGILIIISCIGRKSSKNEN